MNFETGFWKINYSCFNFRLIMLNMFEFWESQHIATIPMNFVLHLTLRKKDILERFNSFPMSWISNFWELFIGTCWPRSWRILVPSIVIFGPQNVLIRNNRCRPGRHYFTCSTTHPLPRDLKLCSLLDQVSAQQVQAFWEYVKVFECHICTTSFTSKI